ncbi:MAG: CpsD/CapB family tyrosine-protein kinase [Bacillota bacterium]
MDNIFNNIKQDKQNYHIISANEPLNAVTEQYRKLRTNIDFSNLNKTIKVINFTSSFPKEGKTVTTLNLGTVYSQGNKKTLIIDMDLRKPKIHRAFNISNTKGLTDIVINDTPVKELIFTATETLHVLPAGEKLPFPAEFLMSDTLKNAMEELRKVYDKILIDCPPMTAVTDANIISEYSDATIVVIASRKSNIDVVKGIVKDLKDNGANVIGSVLTRVRKRDQRYISGYYNYEEYSE